MLQTQNVQFSYLKGAQFNLPDLSCNASETLLLTGNSGTGKTTYLYLLAGLLKPTSGEILINNSNLNSFSNAQLDRFRGKNIGVVFQKSYFVASLSVLENIEMACWLATGKKNTLEAKKIIEFLGLSTFEKKLTSQLSLGQQQRVSIARAIINKPNLLLADEPTSSLDDFNANNVAKLLENIAKEFKTALVIVTHDSRLKDKFSNQIELK